MIMRRPGLVFTCYHGNGYELLLIKNKYDTTCTVAFIEFVLWNGIDNGNVRQFNPRHFTPRHFTPDITRVNQTFPRLIISKRLVIMA